MYSFRGAGRFAPALLAALAVFALACSDASSSPAGHSLASTGAANADLLTTTAKVVVLLDSTTVIPTHVSLFHGYALNAQGDTLRGKTAKFTSSNPAVVLVTAGHATGVKLGTANVQITIDGVMGIAPLLVANPGLPATHVALATQPGGAVTGINLAPEPVVQIRDAANAVVNTSNAPVTAVLVGAGGTLVGTTTVNAVNGVATFTDLDVTGAGTYTLAFTSAPLTGATSGAFTIAQAQAAAASLAVQTQPAGATTGSKLTTQPVVRILGAGGAVLANSVLPVTVTRTAGNGVLTGTTTVNAIAGIATFTDLRLDGSGNNVLTFSIATPSSSVASAGFNVAVGPPAQLVMRTQPVGAASGVAFPTQPVVEIRDVANQLTASALAVTATIAAGAGVSSGPATVNAVNGVATFGALAITGGGNYSLKFVTAAPALNVTSGVFTIGGGPPPPPPPGVHVLFSDGFESGDLSHVENAIRWTNASVDVTANIAHPGTGTHAARFRQGDSFDWAELRFENLPQLTEAFLQYYIYYPSGNENPSVGTKVITNGKLNDKFFRIWGGGDAGYGINPGNKVGASTWGVVGGTDNSMGLEFEGTPPDWPLHPQILEGRTNDALVPWLNDSRRGRWIQMRIRVKVASPANNDGVIQIWADGVIVLSNVGLRNYAQTGPQSFTTGYLLGWGNNHFQNGQYTYIDDFTVSTGGFPAP